MDKIGHRDRVIAGGLFVLFICLYGFLLPDMPLYGDEIGNAERMFVNRWNLIDLYHSYRIIGITVNFLAYKITAASPQALTLLLTIWVMFCVALFAHIFSRSFARGRTDFELLILLIFLASPFSLYLVLLRVVFHEMLTVTLMLLSFMFIAQYATNPRNAYLLWAIPLLYAISLFCYESCLLLPIAMALFVSFVIPKNADRTRALKIIGIGTLTALAVYLSLQYLNYSFNPKLSVSGADYASYNIGLTRAEQVLRVIFFLCYHIKWSFGYLGLFAGTWPFYVTLGLAGYLGLAAVALWNIFPKWQASIGTEQAKKAIATGIAIVVCSFGLWSYYWVFKGSMIFPPLYTLYVPSLGIALACAAMLHLLQPIRFIAWVVSGLIFLGIVLNLTILLSSRVAITNTSIQARELAGQVKTAFGQDVYRYKAIVLPVMEPDGNYARGKARFESMFRHYMSKELGRQFDGLIAVSTKDLRDGYVTLVPHGIRLSQNDVLIIERKTDKVIIGDVPARTLSRLPGGTLDPFSIEFAGYRLKYSVERGNVVLFRIGDEV